MPTDHPIRKAVVVLRCWLSLFTVMMIWNAVVANQILLKGWVRPLPFLLLAVAALVWMMRPWLNKVIICCTALLSMGTFLRGMEVFVFGRDSFDLNTRLTASSVWFTIAGTVVSMGVLGLLAASRKTAEEWVWRVSHDQCSR